MNAKRKRSPIIHWLHKNATWLSALGGIAAVLAVVISLWPESQSIPASSTGDTVQIETVEGDIVGGDKNVTVNVTNPKAIKKLEDAVRRLTDEVATRITTDESIKDELVREAIPDAVSGLENVAASDQQITKAQTALAQGDTQPAIELYRSDADSKLKSGRATPDANQLLLAARSLQNMATLTLFNDIQNAIETYSQAATLYRQAGQPEEADKVVRLAVRLSEFRDEFESLSNGEVPDVQPLTFKESQNQGGEASNVEQGVLEELPYQSNISNGRFLSRQCDLCHDIYGHAAIISDIDQINLAGQSAVYIQKTLVDYQKGRRKDRSMTPIARSLSAQAIKDIAAWYAAFEITVKEPNM